MAPVSDTDHRSGTTSQAGPNRAQNTTAGLAQDAAYSLLQGGPGALLFGSPVRTGDAIRRIIDHLHGRLGNKLQPVRFQALAATPDHLRDVVGKAHAARATPDAWLLLVIADFDSASSALLSELDVAAEAAAQHGGLQFLFGSSRDLDVALRRARLMALATALGGRFTLPPEGDGAPIQAAPATGSLDRPQAEAPPRGIMLRIMVAILAVVAVAGLVIYAILPGGRPAPHPVGVTPLPPPAPSLPPPAPSLPPPAPPLPSAPAPAPAPQQPIAPITPTPAEPPVPAPPPPVRAPLPSPAPPPAPRAPRMPMPLPAPLPPPAAALLLQAQPGDTLESLYARVYRDVTPPPFSDVVAANPEPIRPGARVVFPAPPTGWTAGSAPAR